MKVASLDLRDPSSYPSRRDERWKYSDLRRVLRAAPEPSPEVVLEEAPGGPFAEPSNGVWAVINGRTPHGSVRITGDQRLKLRFLSAAEGTGHSGEVEIAVAAGARLVLLESHEGLGAAYVAHHRLNLTVGEGAVVERLVVADEPADAVSVTEATVTLSPGARYGQTTVASGARLQRLETRIVHPGAGAEARMDGLYLLDERRHADLTSTVEHAGPDGRTSQLVKGVARDEARGAFQGRIEVARGADGTDARMGHHALILGERAEVDAKPELIIYADDVQCAHGNTVGNLDREALFYMQQRGLPLDQARAVLTQAFLVEVVDRIEDAAGREAVRAWVEGRL